MDYASDTLLQKGRKQKTPVRLRPIQGREALAFCVFMSPVGLVLRPGSGFYAEFFRSAQKSSRKMQ